MARPNLPRALAALKRMAWLLDEASAQFIPVQLAEGRNARGRYERLTNEYQDALTKAYQAWTRGLLKQLQGDAEAQKAQIDEAGASLLRTLQLVGQEHLPYAVTAIGVSEYVPSADAWRMIAEAIEMQSADIQARLVPDIVDKIERGVDEEADLRAVADSLIPRLAFYSGNLWVVIQRLVGDFADQAATRDDLVYPCRWVLDPGAEHCQACPEFAGEYESYDAMLLKTRECVPGYFVCYPGKACFLNCRCHIELKIDGTWTRI